MPGLVITIFFVAGSIYAKAQSSVLWSCEGISAITVHCTRVDVGIGDVPCLFHQIPGPIKLILSTEQPRAESVTIFFPGKPPSARCSVSGTNA